MVRVSSKEQEQEGYSLQAQERFLSDYCERVGLGAVKSFHISETASKVDQRKTFNETMVYLKKHQILHFVCEKVDRLLRNFKDTVMVEEWLEGNDTRRLHCPKNSLVLHKNSSSQDKFVWGMHVVVAKNYTDNLSEEVRKGQLEKIRQGWFPAAPPPGYENVLDGGKRVQRVVPTVAPLVVEMFKLAKTKRFTVKSLAREMTKRGLLIDGKPIKGDRVFRMLHNPYYVGVIRWNGKQYPGSHEPIVPVELFEQVQRTLSRSATQIQHYRKHHPLFQGFVTCAACDGLLVWETAKGYWYGKCPKPRSCSRRRFVRQEVIEEQLAGALSRLKAPRPRLTTWLKNELEAGLRSQLSLQEAAAEGLKQEGARIQAKLTILYDDRLEGRINAGEYDLKAVSLHAQQADLARQLRSLEAEDTSYLETAFSFVEMTQRAADEFAKSTDGERKRELISELFDKLILNGEQLQPHYNRRAAWLLTEILPITGSGNDKFGQSDSGSRETKKAPVGASRYSWRAVANSIRTLFDQ
ncbi:recombinase family protein [Streptomyces sp. NBC_00986]|uniref:recombinase family protein n=1 Tax=Streptomyces sp. NBC_00986 TaxID=2903702 RepID=UPI00386C2FFE|nr:recombinase family protein [Streptomyces sp. NBC_00986]